VAFEEIRARFPRYRVEEDGLRRVQMSNVAGFSNVPVEILGYPTSQPRQPRRRQDRAGGPSPG
jgi:hypothetical protein